MVYPGSGSKHFFIPDLVPNIFHPGSYIKRRKNNKTNFFLAIYGFQLQVLVVLIDIRTIEQRILKKIKDDRISPKNVPDPGIEINNPEKFPRRSPIQGVKSTGSGSQHWSKVPVSKIIWSCLKIHPLLSRNSCSASGQIPSFDSYV
jgi:hypothetical protein